MSAPRLTQRALTILATATLSLSGLAALPGATADEAPSVATTVTSSENLPLSQGTVTWGLKQSFRDYLTKPLASGTWNLTDIIDDGKNFTWSQGTGSFDGTQGTLALPGTLAVTAHQGALDMKLTNLRLVIKGSSGVLLVDGSSKAMTGEIINYTNAEFATVDLSTLEHTGTTLSAQQAPVTLTETGAKVFADMYQPGQELDPLSFSANLPTPASTPTPSPTPIQQDGNLSEGRFSWGIKQSFTSYLLRTISPILEDVTLNNNQFTWLSGSGNYQDGKGSLHFPGSLQLVAHGGVMDIKLTNLRLDIQDDHGTLYADGHTRLGELQTFTNKPIITLNLANLTLQDGQLTVENAPAMFTDEGGAIFGRYNASTEADPVSFSAKVAKEPAPTPSPSPEPTPSPEATPTPSPSQSQAPSPAPTSAAPSESSAPLDLAGARKITSGKLSWAFKDSFLTYITGPLARGQWLPGPGISYSGSGFDFTSASGAYDPAKKQGEFKFAGQLAFTGHQGKLDMKISNLRLHVAEGKGYLVADINSKRLEGGTYSAQNIRIGSVNISSLRVEGDTVHLTNAAVALTASGSEAFGGFYPAGTVMAPLNLTAYLGETLTTKYTFDHNHSDQDDLIAAPADGTAQTPGNKVTQEGTHNTTVSGSTGPTGLTLFGSNKATSNPASSSPATCVPVTVTDTVTAKPTQGKSSISNAQLSWGLRSSFRNYIGGGIANGGWNLNQVTYANAAFGWSSGSGNYDQGKGSISFPGSIHFYGHEGKLDLKISDIRIEIQGTQGTLYAKVTSSSMEGIKQDHGVVAFAQLDLANLKTSSDSISITAAPAHLTAEGSKAFADFYSAGEALDPLTFSGKISTETIPGAVSTVTRTEYKGEGCGSLATTGAPSTLPITITSAGILLLAGSAALLVARRRKA